MQIDGDGDVVYQVTKEEGVHRSTIALVEPDEAPAKYDRWQKATDSVVKDWIQEAGAKGANGQALLDDAKAMIKKNGG